jgi:prolipoprotein diacylglyceryl transferase
MIASIPSPGSSSISLGPLELRAYGLMIALGVVAAVWVVGRRLLAKGIDPDVATQLAMVAVPAGLLGARAYHVITDWKRFQGNWEDAIKIWEGGLGIPGGIFAGVLAGIWFVNRRKLPVADLFDAVAVALPLAQAIGRFGNWFNQELFGRPTDLPWALEIDPEHRTAEYIAEETFHPTFLYEMLWNFALFGLLWFLDSRQILKRGRVFAVYVAGYALGRLWIEALRSDFASEILGIRVNIWVMSFLLIGSIAFLLIGGWRRDPDDRDPVLDDEAPGGEVLQDDVPDDEEFENSDPEKGDPDELAEDERSL